MEEHFFNGFRYHSSYENGNFPNVEHSKQTPEYLFKYYSFGKYSIDAFVNSYFYASHPYELNDILDGSRFLFFTSKPIQFQLYRKLYFDEKKVFESESELEQFYGQDVKNGCSEFLSHWYNLSSDYYGIISLSMKEDNALMWPHYTQEKGFQIKFETEDLLKTLTGKLSSHDRLIGLFPINYSSKIEPIDVYKFQRFDIPLIYSTNIKLKKWSYEKEWRLLVSKPKMGIPFEKLGFSDIQDHKIKADNRFVTYGIDAIDSICLGMNFFSGSDFLIRWKGEKEIQVQPRKHRDQCDLRQQFGLYIEFLDFIINKFSGRVYLSGVKYETDKEGKPYLIRTKEKVDIIRLEKSNYLILRGNEIVRFK